MMVTGDHSMTGIAASQQIGLLGKGQPIVVFDKQAPKKGLPGPSELRDSLDMGPQAAAQAASSLTKPPHAGPCRSLASAAGRASLSALTSSSRQSCSSVSTVEAADAAAFRASLRRSHFMLAMPAEMPTSSPSSLAASPSAAASATGDSPSAVAAAKAGAVSAPARSCTSAVQALDASSVASSDPAVALAASSILFKSTSLSAPAALSTAAGLPSAAASAAASTPAAAKIVPKTKTPSPLLASYLRSVSGAKPQSNPEPKGMPEQQPEAAPPHGRTPSADEQPSHAHVTHPESHKASRFSIQASGLQASGTDTASPGSDQLSSPGSGARLSQGLPHTELRSPPRAQRSRQSPFDYFPQLKVHSELQPQDLSHPSPTSPTQLRSCLKGSAQPHSLRQALAESDWQQQRRKTSADMRAWAVEQSEKQQSLSLQGLALSAIRQNLEMQSGHR